MLLGQAYRHSAVRRTLQSEAQERDLIESIVDPPAIAAEHELRATWPFKKRFVLAWRLAIGLIMSAHACEEYSLTNRVY